MIYNQQVLPIFGLLAVVNNPQGALKVLLFQQVLLNLQPLVSKLQPGSLTRSLHTKSPLNPRLLASDQQPGSLASPSHPAGNPAVFSHPASLIITQPLVCVSDRLPASPIFTQPSINSPGSPEGSLFPTSPIITQPSVCGQYLGNPASPVNLVEPSSPACSISGSFTPLIHHPNSTVITLTLSKTFHLVSISSTLPSLRKSSMFTYFTHLHKNSCKVLIDQIIFDFFVPKNFYSDNTNLTMFQPIV